MDELIRICSVRKNVELSKQGNFILMKVTNSKKSIKVLSFYASDTFKIP